MKNVYFIIWLVAFVVGLVVAYNLPEESLSINLKFLFVGVWGAVLGFAYHCIAKRMLQIKTDEWETSTAEQNEDFTENAPEENESMDSETVSEIAESEGSQPSSGQDECETAQNPSVPLVTPFPLDAWNEFCKDILRNRPFSEVVESLETALPKLFPGAAGILYMYGDTQSELQKIFSFGDYAISNDSMMPAECASFNLGEIVVQDYASGEFNGGCTHLHHRLQGYSFCAPIEGLEEHFGTLCIQVDELPEGESLDFWKAKVSIVAATFGLYVANQNLNVRFQQHSIRDNLTGLFNKRYMEESLRREIFAATRHKTPIGIIMLYPDSVNQIQTNKGRHAAEQLLWELGQRLPGYIRNEDIPCRYKGDVFCVILPGADYKITRDRAEKIRNEIFQLQVAYGDGILQTTLSMGVSVMPVHAVDVNTLIATAEASMQLASSNGGNRVILADALQQ